MISLAYCENLCLKIKRNEIDNFEIISEGKGGCGGVGRRQHIGAALCRALGREDLVGREKMRNFVNRLGDKKGMRRVKDKKTMR